MVHQRRSFDLLNLVVFNHLLVAAKRIPGPSVPCALEGQKIKYLSYSSRMPMPAEKANIHLTVPASVESEVMLAINRAGGIITDLRMEDAGFTAISADVPSETLAAFGAWIQEFKWRR